MYPLILSALAVVAGLALVNSTSSKVSNWAPVATPQATTFVASSLPVRPTRTAFVRSTVNALSAPEAADLASQESVQQRPATSTFLPAALAAVVGFCAATWARTRSTGLVDMDSAMASTAGSSEVKYHFLVANAKFMLFDEEQGMELLREKRRFLKEKNIPLDFWIVPNPEFLDQLPDIDKRVMKPCAALVSTDERWIMFMKLRYDRVLMGSFTGPADIKKALATKGGNARAAVPKFELPPDWNKNVPYPKYADDWYLPFLVDAPQS